MEETKTQRSVDVLLAPRDPNKKQVWTDEEVEEIYSQFLMRQLYYTSRNINIDLRKDFFEGKHWAPIEDDEDEDQYRLVLNYCRRTIIGRAASIAKAPKPRISVTDPNATIEAQKAQRREWLLRAIWDKLMGAWYKVEMNAAKCGVGVFQSGWVGPTSSEGDKENVIMESPFMFRSIPPKLFYPIYRSFDSPDDFQAVFRFDPGKLVADISERYKVDLQNTSQWELAMVQTGLWEHMGTQETIDIVEYWTESRYLVLALSKIMIRSTMSTSTVRRGDIRETRGLTVLAEGKNVLGRIPFWVLPNIISDPDEDPTDEGTMSDIDDIMFLNQHINHMVSEEAEEAVTMIHRPIIYASPDHSQDPNALELRGGAIWPIEDEEQIEALNLGDMPSLVDSHYQKLMKSLEDLSFLGEAGLGRADTGISGVAAQISLTPQKQFIELKIPLRIQILKSIVQYILQSFEKHGGATKTRYKAYLSNMWGEFGNVVVTPGDIDGKYYCNIIYGNLLPRNDYEYDQNELYRYKAGAQSLYTTLDRMDGEAAHEIERIRLESEDPRLNPESAIAISQAKQVVGQSQNQSQPPAPPTPPGPQGGAPQGGQPPTNAPVGQTPETAQNTRPLQQGPSMQSAPPVPSRPAFSNFGAEQNPTGPGMLAPSLGRSQVPNQPQVKPGVNRGG